MYLGLAVVLLALAASSVLAGVRVRGDAGELGDVAEASSTDQVRGFCLVGAFGSFLVAIAVLAIGGFWDGRTADTVALVALFALVVYNIAALAIVCWPVGRGGPGRRSGPDQIRRRRRTAIPAATMPAVPAPTRPNRIAFRPVR